MRIHRRSRLDAWAVAGLVAYGLAVAAILVLPVSYSGIVNAIGQWLRSSVGVTGFGTGWIEFAANVLMFAPLGFLLTVLFRRFLWGVLVAIALSAGAELIQIVIPLREPALRDVLANSLGAASGAVIAWIVLRGRSAKPLDKALAEPDGISDARSPVEDRTD